MKNKKLLLAAILSLALTLITTWLYKDRVFEITSERKYADLYANSQYVKDRRVAQLISDSDLYTYAAIAYAKGEDPTTINFEHPPFAKYCYSLAYLLFQRANLWNLLVYFFWFLGIYLVSKKILKQDNLAILSMLLFFSLKISRVFIAQVMLDQTISVMILWVWILLFNQSKSWFKFLIIGALLGGIAASKYYLPTIPFLLLIILGFLLIKKQVKKLSLILLSLIAVYLLTYLQFFLHQHSFSDFLAFEKYRFSWFMEGRSNNPKALIWQSTLMGFYRAWWEGQDLVVHADWEPSLALLMLLWLITSLKWLFQIFNLFKLHKFNFKKILKDNHFTFITIIQLFCWGEMAIFTIGSMSDIRYLLPILPFWILLIIDFYKSNFCYNKD